LDSTPGSILVLRGVPLLRTDLRDTPPGSTLVLIRPRTVRPIKSGATQSLDAPEDLPKAALRQVPLGHLEPMLPGMPPGLLPGLNYALLANPGPGA